MLHLHIAAWFNLLTIPDTWLYCNDREQEAMLMHHDKMNLTVLHR
uniref:Uncharacterized protein n=1 Tax=Arundo donax TaxID=35708 RepID=A0A0A9EBY4_ARUDO